MNYHRLILDGYQTNFHKKLWATRKNLWRKLVNFSCFTTDTKIAHKTSFWEDKYKGLSEAYPTNLHPISALSNTTYTERADGCKFALSTAGVAIFKFVFRVALSRISHFRTLKLYSTRSVNCFVCGCSNTRMFFFPRVASGFSVCAWSLCNFCGHSMTS